MKEKKRIWTKPFFFHVKSGVGTRALVYVLLSNGWRQIPAPRKGRKSREWESGNQTSLPDQASIRLWITLYSAALIYDEKSHKQLQIVISICPDESSFGFCTHLFSCPGRVCIWSFAGIYCLGKGTESACKYSSVGLLTLLQWHKENMRFDLNTQFSMRIQI